MFNKTIELDPCSNKFSIVNANVEYMPPENDGFSCEWNFRTIYVNPPYGTDRTRGTTIKNWLRKCTESHRKHDSEILALIPVATNTTHWKHYIFGEATAVCLLYDTRLKFIIDGDDDNIGAPMTCCMVYRGNNLALGNS
jgi:Zn-finger protein